LAKEIPVALLASLKNVEGFDEIPFVQTHQSEQPIVSIRINPAKFDIEQVSFTVEGKVPWSSNGYYLTERPSFTIDPLFHAGAYYVQEASSMFLEAAIRQSCDLSQPLRVLDLCAAPGGKSTLIQSVISEDSLLVSNELIKSRANILVENMTKWGAANVVVTNNEPQHFERLPDFFDLIVVDAPCSGSGLFRKDPEAIDEWSLNNVALCSHRQQKILLEVMGALKPGGVLIYSTCSYSKEENEEIADWLLQNLKVENMRLAIDEGWGIVETTSSLFNSYGYRFYPDKLKGEGFFMAAFKKHSSETNSKELKPKNKLPFLSKIEVAILEPYVIDPEKYSYMKWQDEVLAFPASMQEAILSLQNVLYIKKAGIKIGTIIRNELIPDHEWAISVLASEKVPKVAIDLETALQYLRRKDIGINSDTKGWAILTYRGLSLGLVKILIGRVNNYYPKEWRILNK
jgi:16S rRNA C967 or C1407 C5-methylase (RsmB/RsmF family)/NOL1/NOP2/fmu family ribosome biogenesis protein